VHPPEGAAFPEPGRIEIAATAEDVDGRVMQVAFYDGENLLGVVPNPAADRSNWSMAYRLLWTNVPQGRYTLSAVATDDSDASTRSLPVASCSSSPTPS
jgi:hypothetical protein